MCIFHLNQMNCICICVEILSTIPMVYNILCNKKKLFQLTGRNMHACRLNTLPVKVHDATLHPLLNIMDSASLTPVAEATVHNLLSPIVI